MNDKHQESSIENLIEMRDRYKIKQCEEKGTNDKTNKVVLYTTRAMYIWVSWLHRPSKSKEEIDEFNKIINELNLVLMEINEEA